MPTHGMAKEHRPFDIGASNDARTGRSRIFRTEMGGFDTAGDGDASNLEKSILNIHKRGSTCLSVS
jgi:hypothetical protein